MRRAILPALVLVFAALALPSSAWSKRVALVVGIDSYDNLPESQQLRKAVNDAHALGAALQGLGYQVVSADNAGRHTFNEKWQILSLIEPGDSTAFFCRPWHRNRRTDYLSREMCPSRKAVRQHSLRTSR